MSKLLQGLVLLVLLGISGVTTGDVTGDSTTPAMMSTQDYDFYPGDFDGDGYTDVLYIAKDPSHLSGIILSDGTSLTLPFQSWDNAYLGIPWTSGLYNVIVADFNGDGKADILLQRKTPGDSYLLLTGATGIVAISQTIANTTAGVVWSADQHRIVAGDFNGDGKADVFLQATSPSGVNAVILTDGNGQFTAMAPAQSWNDGYLGFNWATTEALVYSGDFNGDEHADLLIQAEPAAGTGPGTTQSAFFPPNMNGAVFAQPGGQIFIADGVQAWSRDGFSADWSPLDSVVVVGDFDGDGRSDVLLQGLTANNSSYLLYGSVPGPVFSAGVALSSSIVPTADNYRLVVGHFDSSPGAGVLLQAQTRGQTNYFGHIRGAALVAAPQIAPNPIWTAANPAAPAPMSASAMGASAATLTVTSAGRTAGQFSVTPTGGSSYNIPIWTPPGARDIEPHLALHYTSGGPDGIMGPGWSLTGISAIARCGKTWASNGSPAAVTLATSDDLCLDGNRLRLTTGTQGMGASTYLAEIADFSLVTAGGAAGNPLTYFTVKGKDGRYYEYGNTADSKVTASGAVAPYLWMLDKVSDRQGNNMVFAYAGGTAATVSTIQYTATPGSGATFGYKVAFNYTQRTGGTSITKYVAGSAVTQSQELTNINVTSAGTSVRQYNLIYAASATTNRPLLQSMQECGGSTGTDCLRPTAITYQTGGAGWSTLPVSTGISGQYSYIPVDLNGDGIPDALYLVKSGSNYQWYARIALTFGFGSPIYTGLSATYQIPIIPGNFSGKSSTQFIALVNSAWTVFSFNGTGFTTATTNVSGNVLSIAVDYDGDGLPDIVSTSGNSILVQRNVTTPGGAVTFASTATNVWTLTEYNASLAQVLTAPSLETADFNGDGRGDLLALSSRPTPHGGEAYAYHALASNGFAAQATNMGLIGMTGGNPEPVAVGDMNGDGCTDLFLSYYYYQSNCTSFTTIATGAPTTALPVIATDWDGDGQTDFLYAYSGQWYLERSTGSGLSLPVATGISAPATRAFFTVDQNSDGQPDLAYIDAANGYNISYLPHNGVKTPPDLATSITDGFGINFSPTYVPINQGGSIYTKGTTATYPDEDFLGPMYVVNQLTQSDGLGGTFQESFTYTGARLNLQGRGFEGFATTEMLDSRNSLYHKAIYHQDFPYIGSPSEDDVYQPNGTTLMSTTTNSYLQKELVSITSGYSQSGSSCSWSCFPYVSTTKIYHHEVGGTKNGNLIATDVTNYTYDAFGSLTSTTSTTTDNDSASPTSPFNGLSWSTNIINTITNDTTNWCLGRPSTSKTTKTAAGEPALTRTVTHSIDYVNCRANNEIVEPGDPRLQVTTNFLFDPTGCGNTTSASVIGLDQNGVAMPARTTTTSYGTHCQFPESVKNALNQTTMTAYRYDLGLKSSMTDPNGIIVQWYYDDFGRETKELRPDGTATTWALTDCVSDPCWGVSSLRLLTTETLLNTSGGSIRVHEKFTDGLDRLRYDEANRVLGVWTNQTTYYDNLGRKTEVVLPYSSASNGYHLISYDLANRPTADKLYTSSGSLYRTISMGYQGQTATVTDPLLNMITKVTDVSGKLRQVTDPAVPPAAAGKTYYTYDSFGNLVKIQDAKNALSTYSYNIRGFKTGATDADAGVWSFTPDSLNELVSQKDANLQTTSFGYDLLGRMTSRLEPESSTPTTWVYGVSAALHNIGQVQSLSKPDGYAEQNTFDSDGRLNTKIYTEDSTNYQFDYAYNTNGTIDTLKYPTSTSGVRFQLKYVYDSTGFLNQTKDASAGTVFWNLTLANDSSLPMTEGLGNGVLVESTYTAWTNETLTRTEGANGSTNNLQNLSYAWDVNGNLQQRKDNRQSLTEVFTVDHMNRLSTVTLNGSQTLSVTYDPAGDILTKSDVGTYTYGSSAHPHAVTAAGSWSIGYDANGNMSSRAGGAITSYSYNLPNQINFNGSSSQFNYDANHQRWKQVASYSGTAETVHYVGGLFQVVNRAGITEYRHQVAAGSSSVIYTRRSDLTNSTYYATSDHLGSADLMMDSSANVLVRESFGPFGARRGSNWQGLPTTGDYSAMDTTTRQGFTGHEMLDTVSLVHMNGRVYDPTIGRFLSADTVIQSLGATQSINPYSYAWNDPLRYVDPSGHSVGDFIVALVAIAFSVITWGMASPYLMIALGNFWGGIAAAALAGFVGGFTGALLTTGSLSAALTAGLISGLAAGLFNVVGSLGQEGDWGIGARTLAHAAVGCAYGAASSGNCGKGALSAGVSEYLGNQVLHGDNLASWGSGEMYAQTAKYALIGGIAARLAGGKFDDGFSVGAAGYLYNDSRHNGSNYYHQSLEVASEVNADPRVQAFLATLAQFESGGQYDAIVGGDTFDDFSQHPDIYVESMNSTAAGAYQFTKPTWDTVSSALGLGDFSPTSQDLGAVYLLGNVGAIDSLLNGNVTEAIYRAAARWDSFPLNSNGTSISGGYRALQPILITYKKAGGW